ncbi:MAG TPA: hypothetical protein VFE01_04055, partial [Terracidiphilus sp.]|nr:hypothetical protein [Terracidiphilus sp.]
MKPKTGVPDLGLSEQGSRDASVYFETDSKSAPQAAVFGINQHPYPQNGQGVGQAWTILTIDCCGVVSQRCGQGSRFA